MIICQVVDQKVAQINAGHQRKKERKKIEVSLELINKKYILKDDIQLYFYDNLFDTLLKDNNYIDLITIIHYVIRKLEVNDYKDENGYLITNRYGYLKEAIINNIEKLKNHDILWEY